MPADPGTGSRRITSSPRPTAKPPKRKPKRPDETIGARYTPPPPIPERKPKRPPEGTGSKPPKKTVRIPTSLVTGMPFTPAPGAYYGPKGTHSALGPPSGPVGGKKDRPEVTFRARPDIEDRRSILEAGGMAGLGGGVRKQNLQRGAKTSGGPGTKEIEAFKKAANAAANKPTGQHIAELQRNLRSQGYDIAVDGVWGPQSHRALVKAQGVMGKTAKIEYRRKVKRVLADPGSHPEEMVEIFGFKGAQKLSAAWRQEAQERLLAARAAKADDPDFLAKWARVSRSLPGVVAGTVGGVAGDIAAAGTEQLLQTAYQGSKPGQQRGLTPLSGLDLSPGVRGAIGGLSAQERTAEALTIGVDLAAYLKGEDYDETGLKIDLALAPLLVVGRPIQGLRTAAVTLKAARAGVRGEELAELASKTYRGAGILKSRRMKAQEAKRVRAALTANGEISQAIIKDTEVPLPKGLTPAHDRSLKKARELEVKVKEREDAGRGSMSEEDYEKEVKGLKAERKNAYAEETYQRLRAIFPDHVLDRADAKFAARQNVAKTLATQLKGKQGALPEGAKTEHKIQQLFTFLDSLIDEGMEGRHWYENSAKAILAVTKGDKVQAERLAQLLAIYSPQQPIIGNTSLAIRAWNQFHELGGKIATGTPDQIKKATDVMNGGSFEGRKTNNFYVNFLEDINPKLFREMVERGEIRAKGVTVDMWMARVFGYNRDAVAERRYDFMESVMQHLADERGAGWKPKQVQAAIWTAIKHHALTDTSANIDFSDAIVRHYGSFSWAAQPGSGADPAFVALYESWPDHVKAMLHHGYAELADGFLGEIHLLTQRSDIGPMVRDTDEGLQIASLAQTEVMTSAAPRPSKEAVKGFKEEGLEPAQYMYYVHPDEQAALDFAAAAMGKAFQIPDISWSRLSEPISKGHANVRRIKIGRDATDEEAERVWRAVNPDGQERVRVQHAVDGLVLTNVSEDLANIGTKNNPQFREVAEAAARDVFKEVEGKGSIEGYASHTRELGSEEYGVHLADGHTGGAGRDGRAIEAAVRLESDAEGFRTRLATAFPPGSLDPPALPRTDAPAAGLAQANERALAGAKDWQDEVAREAGLDEEEIAAAQEALGLRPTAGSGLPYAEGLTDPTRWTTLRTHALDAENVYTARYGETLSGRKVQLPQSRSWVENKAGVKAMDWASRQASKIPYVHDSYGIRYVTMHDRAVGALGRQQRFEIDLGRAEMAPEIKTLSKVVPDSDKDFAHSWWQQLPEAYRTNEGLRLVQSKQREFLEYLMSGKALASVKRQRQILIMQDDAAKSIERYNEIERQIRDTLKAQIAKAETLGDEAEVAELKELLSSRPSYEDVVADKKRGWIIDDLQRLDNMEADIPLKVSSTQASIARLEQVIAAEVKPDPKLFAALRRLSEDRTKTLIEAGAVAEERAAARTGLVSRWLGLEPDGTEIYFGHRMPDPTDPVGSYGGTGGTGKVRGPAGAGTKNRQALINSGRSHMSVVVAYQDWEKSRAFRQALTNRENIYSFSTENYTVGRKIDPKEEILVNPKSRIIPAWWKVGDLSQFTDNVDDAEQLRALAHEMTRQWLGDFEDVSDYTKWIHEATTGENAVVPTDLMIVKRRDVDHYYAQFKAPNLGKRKGTRIYDRLVDAAALSLVVLRLGYIPKNIAQNAIMAVADQGPLLLVNAVRAAQVLIDPEIRMVMRKVGAEITEESITESKRFRSVMRNFAGSGAYATVAREQSMTMGIPLPRGRKLEARAILGFIRGLADDPARMSSFLHEAAGRGIFGPAYKKVVPWLTTEDRKALIELWSNPRHRELLYDTAYGGTEGMGNFARMNPQQAREARRLLVVPSWLLAGTRYPFMFARNHPLRSMLIAYMALGDPADKVPDQLWFEKPAWTYIEGEGYKQGIETPYGRLRTTSINPVSMPWEMAEAIYGTLKGGQSPWDFESKAAWDMANPMLASLLTMIAGEGRPADLPFTDWDLPTAGELGRVAPQIKQLYQLITGDVNNAGYPAEETRWDLIRRELGILPLRGLDEEGGGGGGGAVGPDDFDEFFEPDTGPDIDDFSEFFQD